MYRKLYVDGCVDSVCNAVKVQSPLTLEQLCQIIQENLPGSCVPKDNLKEDARLVILDDSSFTIQAVPGIIKNQWRIQFYDDEHIFMREIHMNAMDKFDILRWIQSHFCIVKGLCANVLVDPNGDFTNNGISSKYSNLYILDTGKGCCGDEPGDLRECVQIKEEKGRVYARPIIYGQKWYMMGGNFLYSSDYRFWKLAEVDHPVPIYDRCES